jgi:hypothetical protein
MITAAVVLATILPLWTKFKLPETLAGEPDQHAHSSINGRSQALLDVRILNFWVHLFESGGEPVTKDPNQ